MRRNYDESLGKVLSDLWSPTDEEVAEAIRAVPAHYAVTGGVSSGATKVTRVLTAANQEVTIWCENQNKVGINIFSVTGSNTFKFMGSTDGIQWNTLSVTTVPGAVGGQGPGSWSGNVPSSGSVTSATAAGTWEAPVGNLKFIRVQMTSGSGPAKVILAASVDGSYQEAFQTPTNIGINQAVVFPSTTSTASDTNTMTIPAVANATINLTFLSVSMAGGGFGGNAQLRVWDGAVGSGVPLFQAFPTAPVGSVGTVQKFDLPEDAQGNKGVQGTPGNAMVIQIRNLGNTSSIINTRVSYL